MTFIRLRLRNAETTRLEEEIHDLRGPAVLGRSRDADILLSDPQVSRGGTPRFVRVRMAAGSSRISIRLEARLSTGDGWHQVNSRRSSKGI